MKKAVAALVLILVFACCATSNYSSGKNFPSESVSSIAKGNATVSDLKALIGEIFAKSPVNETHAKWVNTYANGPPHAQSYVVTISSRLFLHSASPGRVIKGE